METKLVVRSLAIVLLVGSVVACAVEIGRLDQDTDPSMPPIQDRNDPLAAELARCKALGAEGVNDSGCKAAWAKDRERFFAPSPSHTTDSVRAAPQRPSTKLPSEMFPDRAPSSLWPDAGQTRSMDR